MLVVDDEPEVLYTYKRLLERSLPNVEVIGVDSAIEGLKVLRSRKVSLVLSDFRMPEMDGLEFLTEARRLNPRVPRIMITAYPDAIVKEKAKLQAEAVAFLHKDIEPAALVDTVRRNLRR